MSFCFKYTTEIATFAYCSLPSYSNEDMKALTFMRQTLFLLMLSYGVLKCYGDFFLKNVYTGDNFGKSVCMEYVSYGYKIWNFAAR